MKCPESPTYDNCSECEATYQPCHPLHNKRKIPKRKMPKKGTKITVTHSGTSDLTRVKEIIERWGLEVEFIDRRESDEMSKM